MNSHLLHRALGNISSQTFERLSLTKLLHALQPASNILFDGSDESRQQDHAQQHATLRGGIPHKVNSSGNDNMIWAHRNSVNCLTIDRFEGRYMLSGGAESSILLWDLEKAENAQKCCTHRPIATTKTSHKFGVTHLSFYPFDSLAFLSSSYDHTIKIYATETFVPSASFDLNSVVYSHALSPIAHHLLVACATQHSAVRLVDLRSGARAHSLPGHQGAVLSVAWSPRQDYLLASGGSDGSVRLWDIRRSSGSIGVLDLEDFVGTSGEDGSRNIRGSREQGKAHVGACNGVVWADDGKYLVTAGHDERVRVWDAETYANTLSHFGPTIKNTRLATILPILAPSHMLPEGSQLLLYPNEKEILMFDLCEGTLISRLRHSSPRRMMHNRVTSLCWREGNVAMYSAHSDGLIRAWKPRTKEEMELLDGEESPQGDGTDNGSRKRKRQVLDDIHRDLTKRKITFT